MNNQLKTIVFSHNQLLTGLVSIIIGILLIVLKKEFIDILLIVAGYAMLVLAVVFFILFLKRTEDDREHRWAYFPFRVTAFSIIGILLIVFPSFWVSLSAVVFAVLILLLSCGKITLLIQLRRNSVDFSYLSFILPGVLAIASIVAIIHPDQMLGSMAVVFGLIILVFGITELIDYILIRNGKLRKRFGSIGIVQEDNSGEDQHIETVEVTADDTATTDVCIEDISEFPEDSQKVTDNTSDAIQ